MSTGEDFDGGPQGGEWHPDDTAGLPPEQQQGQGQGPETPQAPAASEQPDGGRDGSGVEVFDHVYFVLPVGPCKGVDRAALVTRVLDAEEGGGQGQVDLHVFGTPTDHPNVTSTHLVHFAERVAYSADRRPATWHWPGDGEGEQGA